MCKVKIERNASNDVVLVCKFHEDGVVLNLGSRKMYGAANSIVDR